MEKKFTLTDETMQFNGKTLYRIKSLKSFGDVKKDELGGWLEKEINLSQYGTSWVHNNAKVIDKAFVFEDGQVSGRAEVSGEAKIYGESWVWNNAKISGKAKVCDNAVVGGYVEISGSVRVCKGSKLSGEVKLDSDNTEIYNLWMGEPSTVKVL